MTQSGNRNSFLVLVVAGIVWVFFLLGLLFPEPFWATHFLAFLPAPLGWGILIVTAGLIIAPLFLPQNEWFHQSNQLSRSQRLLLFAGLSVVAGILFSAFPIHTDVYGDAPYIEQNVEVVVTDWTPELSKGLFYFNPFDSKMGTASFYGLCNLGSWITGKSGLKVLGWIDVFSGMLFIFLWLMLVHFVTPHRSSRILFSLMGLSAPWLLMFFKHHEIYAPSMPLMLAYLGALVVYFKKRSGWWLLSLPFLFLLTLKFHITGYLLFPSLVMAGIHFLLLQNPNKKPEEAWGQWMLKGWTPVILMGIASVVALVAYGLFLARFNGTREYNSETLNQVLFLPISVLEGPPLDRYSLFSGWHLLDYLNLLLFCSPGALFLLGVMLVKFRKQLKWLKPEVVVLGVTLFGYLLAFFLLNPLLGMSIDWDLFVRPAPVLLVFVLVLGGQIKEPRSYTSAWGAMAAFFILGLLLFGVNANPSSLSLRLESLGKWEFRTYYFGASTSLNTAYQLSENGEETLERRLKTTEALRPYATPEVDVEFADQLYQIGVIYADSLGQPEVAVEYFKDADTYSPVLRTNVYRLLVTHFMLGNYQEANELTRRLISVRYPNYRKAYKIAIHVAVEAEDYSDALEFCGKYLEKWPDDQFIIRVHDALETGENLDQVRLLFQQG